MAVESRVIGEELHENVTVGKDLKEVRWNIPGLCATTWDRNLPDMFQEFQKDCN